MTPRDTKRFRRSIEENFFVAMNDWLAYDDGPRAARKLESLAEEARESGLAQVADAMVRLLFAVKDGEDPRRVIWWLRNLVGGGRKHVFASPLNCLMGQLQIKLADHAMAIRAFKAALELQPFYCPWEAWQGMGVAHYFMNRPEEAKTDFQRAIQYPTQPHLGAAYLNLGEVHWKLGETRLAEQAYKHAVEEVNDPYQRAYLHMKLADIDSPLPVRQSDVLPVDTGAVVNRAVEEHVTGLVKDKLIPVKQEENIRERAARIVVEYEADAKTRLYLERFSPKVVAEVVRQHRDLKVGVHRGRLLEEQITRRRQYLTALKVSLRGFTAHFKFLDPEDQIQFIGDFLNRIATVVFSYNGALDRIQATNVIAYFGHMNAGSEDVGHQQAAVDAVDAAFAMQEELINFFKDIKKHFFELPVERIRLEKGGYDLRQRTLGLAIGVSTGWCNFGCMPVGDRNGRLMVGHAINIAHRLTEVSRPREVLTSQSTYDLITRLAGDRYEFEDITGNIEMDGGVHFNSLKDYENRPIYAIKPLAPLDYDSDVKVDKSPHKARKKKKL